MKRSEETGKAFARLYDIIVRLRSEGGCPWDREQTAQSIRGNLIEEAYECVEAIDENVPSHIREELGDVFLVAIMMSVIHEEHGAFSCADAAHAASDKLIRRHPHVFAPENSALDSSSSSEAVLRQWNDIKENVEGRKKKDSALDAVSKAFPPLERAYKIQKAAAKAGFDWPNAQGAWNKLDEELAEAKLAAQHGSANALENELGDVLFSVINVARKSGIDPSLAMLHAVEKFSQRYRYVEQAIKQKHPGLDPESQAALMDSYWDEAKSRVRI